MKNFIENNKLYCLILLVFGIVGTFLRIKFYLLNPPLFQDECGTAINLLERDYIGLFKPLDYVQVAPPIYLVFAKFILDFFIKFNNVCVCDIGLKIIPLISSIAVLPLFAYFCHKVYRNKLFTVAALLLLSINITAIDYAQEFKPYSTEVLWTVILSYCFYYFDLNKVTCKKLNLYLLIFCLSLWSSLYSIFILLSGVLIVLYKVLKSRDYNIRRISYFFLIMIINFIAYVMFFVIPGINYNYEVGQRTWEYLENAFLSLNNIVHTFCSTISSLFYNGEVNINLFYLFAAICTIALLCKRNSKMAIVIFVPMTLCIVASFFNIFPFVSRTLLFLLPLIIMFGCQPLLLLKDNNIKLGIIFLIGLSLFYGVIKDKNFNNNFKNMHDILNEEVYIKEARSTYENLPKEAENLLKYYGCIYSDHDWDYLPWKYYGMINNNFIDFNITDNVDYLEKNKLYYGYINCDKNGEYKEIDNINVLEEYEKIVNDENEKMDSYSVPIIFDFKKAKLFSFKIN